MSFQAYLDNIEDKTGKNPNDFIALAQERGFTNPATKAGVILEWLKTDFGIGRGYGMALVHVIKHGTKISNKQLGTGKSHSDESAILRLDGKQARG